MRRGLQIRRRRRVTRKKEEEEEEEEGEALRVNGYCWGRWDLEKESEGEKSVGNLMMTWTCGEGDVDTSFNFFSFIFICIFFISSVYSRLKTPEVDRHKWWGPPEVPT